MKNLWKILIAASAALILGWSPPTAADEPVRQIEPAAATAEQAEPPAADGPAAVEPAQPENPSEPAPGAEPPLPAAPGTYWTSQGGSVDEPGTRSVDISAGFPGINVMFSLPIVRHLEVDPFFGINYWGPITEKTPIVSTNIGARLKLNGYSRGPLQIALVADLSFGVSLYPENGFMMNVTFPQLLISGQVAPKVHLFGGMKIPVTLTVHPDFRLGMAFAGHFGAEFLISERLHVFVATEIGPEIYWVFKESPAAGESATQSAVGAWFQAMTGVAVKF